MASNASKYRARTASLATGTNHDRSKMDSTRVIICTDESEESPTEMFMAWPFKVWLNNVGVID